MNHYIKIILLYSRLLSKGFNRKKLILDIHNNLLLAENNSRNTYFSIIFSLLGCGLLFTGFFELLNYNIKVTIDFVIIFFVIHLCFGVLALRHFLWLIFGKQVLIMDSNKLILMNKGTFFPQKKEYLVNNIAEIRQKSEYDNNSIVDEIRYNIRLNRILLSKQVEGQILFNYKGKTISFFNDLNDIEKGKLVNEIKRIIVNNYKS